MPNTQAFIEALAKQGLDVLPYAKYVALAFCIWYVALGLLSAIIFGYIVYQFIKMSRGESY